MNLCFTFLRLAKRLFLNLSVALILFFLPIDVLFQLGSWALFMPTLDIIKEIPVMVVLLSLVLVSLSVLIAGIVTLIFCILPKISERIEKVVCAATTIGTVAIILVLFLQLLKKWLQQITGVPVALGVAKIWIALLIIGCLVLLVRKFGLQALGNSLQTKLAKGNKAVLILIVMSVVAVALNGISLHDYHEVKTNPISSPRDDMPNVILLTVDTLTAEDMALYGYHLPTTPQLEAFANESYVFDNFFSSSNWTLPSVASLISGLYPSTSGVHQFNSYYLEEDRKKNIAQLLKDNGYQSSAIVANSNGHPLTFRITESFSAVTELPIRKIFATDPIFSQLSRMKNYQTSSWVRDLTHVAFKTASYYLRDDDISLWGPELVFSRTLPFVSSLKQPSFIWAHINPPHSPYLPAAPFKYQFGKFKEFSTLKDYNEHENGKYSPKQQAEVDQLRLRYDEFILDTDSRVGEFLKELKKMGRFEDSIIIITSDHGESFTKGYHGHAGAYLHQPLIHIPMLIHLPGQKKGERIRPYAGQVDLLPTVMDLLNLPIPKWADGESLESVMLKGKPTTQPKFSMNLDTDSRFEPPSKGSFAVMQDDWKLVRYLATGKEELYHLASDPKEEHDLANSNPEQAKKMRGLIEARFNLDKGIRIY